MAEFNSVVTTENGLKLIALSAGMTKPLTFTRLAIGAGRPATGDDITKYTAVKNQKLIYSVSKIAPVSDGTGAARWSVYTAFSNDTLDEGFYMTEIGLYAKVAADSYTESGWNGYKGEEVLFGYAYALVDKADWLPDKSTPLDVMEWVIYASVGNASSVTAVIPAETCARAEDLTNHINDTNPHPKVFANYTKKTDFTAHINDTNPHAKVFANYLKTADLTPVKLYDVLHSYGNNFVPSDVSNSGWGALGSFISYYTQKKIKNQPSQYGQLINICADKSNESTQLWIEQNSGKLAYRGGNGSIVMNDTPFTYVASANDLASAKSDLQNSINNVAAQAGIIAGNVSNANSWWVKFGGTIPLIIQGGKTGAHRTADANSLTFPVSYSSSNILVLATRWYDQSSRAAIIDIRSVSKTGATFSGAVNDEDGGWYYNMAGMYSWISIGY